MPPPKVEATPRLLAPMRDAVHGQGKRLRPALLMLVCETLGGPVEEALPVAAAIELMHNFTLVHDDIIDHDDLRRGGPTIRKKWGDDIALLTGDSLLGTRSPHLPLIAQRFTDAIIELCNGQALDCEFERRDDVTVAAYLDMIAGKTARLFSLCAEIGARLASATEPQIKLLRQFGEQLGLGFQVQDDLLDITVAQKILGKDFGSDVRRRKRTFLYVHVMTHGAPRYRECLQKLFQKPEILPTDILTAQRIFYESGAIVAADTAMRRRLQQARHCLGELESMVLTNELSELIDTIARRNM